MSVFIAYSNPKADFCAEAAKGRFVRITDIYVFSSEGPVWVIFII